MPSFSLRWLFLATAFAGLVCAAMFAPSKLPLAILNTLVLGFCSFALFRAFIGGRSDPFWLGAVAFIVAWHFFAPLGPILLDTDVGTLVDEFTERLATASEDRAVIVQNARRTQAIRQASLLVWALVGGLIGSRYARRRGASAA